MTNQYFNTEHDVIPNFAYAPTIVSVQDGLWEDVATWNLGRTPTASDVVLVQHVVEVLTADAAVIGVEGTLRLLEGLYLDVGTLQPHSGGRLETDGIISGEIVIKDRPLDLVNDPNQFGTGIIGVDAHVHLNGISKTPWARLTAEPVAGHDMFSIVTDGWEVGDQLLIPDTREVRSGTLQIELPTVTAADANAITLAAGLAYDHLGARDLDGVLRFLPHVGNLSRSLKIRSANPAGTRGHIMVTGASHGSVEFVELRNLGRTTEAELHSVNNPPGRYPMHVHHLEGHDFFTDGLAIFDARKWGVAIHDTDYIKSKRGVIYHATGAGIATESGTEIGNEIHDNFVVRCDGSGSNPNNYKRSTSFKTDNGHVGDGIWCRAEGNSIKGNVTANCHWSGYQFFARYGNIGVADMQPILVRKDTDIFQTLDTRRLVPVAFENNEAYACDRGPEAWYEFATPIKNYQGWHCNMAGMYLYYGAEAEIDGYTYIGAGTTENGFLSEQGLSLVAKNVDIQGCIEGIQIKPVKKSVVLRDSVLRNVTNLNIVPPDVPLQKPIQFINVTFKSLDGLTSETKTGLYNGAEVDNSGPYTHPWSITSSLAPEQVVSGTVTITVTRAGPINDGKIDFYISGKSVKSDNTSPFNYVWNTTTWANGPHWVQIEWGGSNANPGLRDWKSFRVVVNNP